MADVSQSQGCEPKKAGQTILGQFILFFGAEPTVSTAVCIFHRSKVSHAA